LQFAEIKKLNQISKKFQHDHGFSDEEMQKQKAVVYNNTVQAMAQILRGMQQLNITFDNPALESEQRIVLGKIFGVVNWWRRNWL
jgi:hypothetical protein